MKAEEVRAKLNSAFPDAIVEVRDFTGGGDHFEALVVSAQFEGRTMVERHKMVYDALGDSMKEEIHALSLKTLSPAQYQSGSFRR